ncbi:MAG: DUF1080 domain-containing protein, partial [Phycisphaerales bacterium]|nr:DUF1080 domain-containing protein [Phycisphaerales bacterium]
SLKKRIPHNFFLTHERTFMNFQLRLKFKLSGDDSRNAGIQVRSRRIPNHHEMIGYQADLGQNYWGALYDESRRRKVLAGPNLEDPEDWNNYRIRCEGRRVQLWINDYQTVDYTEEDESLEQVGLIGLQIHGGSPAEVRYKDIVIEELE